MIKFTIKEIQYLKSEVKEAWNMLNDSYEQKEIMEYLDKEDREIIEGFYKDETLFDKINTETYRHINKAIETFCWSVLGMANLWLRHFDREDVMDIMKDEIYSDTYVKNWR